MKLVEGDIKQSSGELFAVYLKLGHVNLLAKDFAKGNFGFDTFCFFFLVY